MPAWKSLAEFTTGWKVLWRRWKVSWQDFDYLVLNSLFQKTGAEQEEILKHLATRLQTPEKGFSGCLRGEHSEGACASTQHVKLQSTYCPTHARLVYANCINFLGINYEIEIMKWNNYQKNKDIPKAVLAFF